MQSLQKEIVSFSDKSISTYIHNEVLSSQIQQLKRGEQRSRLYSRTLGAVHSDWTKPPPTREELHCCCYKANTQNSAAGPHAVKTWVCPSQSHLKEPNLQIKGGTDIYMKAGLET